MKRLFLFLVIAGLPFLLAGQVHESRQRSAGIGLRVGVLQTGPMNMITDVEGVGVGQLTRMEGEHIRTGVTAILPHSGNLFQNKVPAAIYCFNGFGKLAGYLQVKELGNIEAPIVLTNTLSVGTAVEAVVQYVLSSDGNETVRSVNAVVGETNDGYLNDIRGQHITTGDVKQAIMRASAGPVEEGTVGAGTGTTAFGYKGGIGTASRLTPPIEGKQYTLGVLVQTNFGRSLYINGIPFSPETHREEMDKPEDGSCMIVIATDAPLGERNLERIARRSFVGMGRTTDVMTNGSGDFAIAFSTAYTIPHAGERLPDLPPMLGNNAMNALFQAVEEATREAIYNSLFMATPVTGQGGRRAEAISLERVSDLLKMHQMFDH
ncbi:MAG: P1 family peptidase [Bacteroidales bacterium]